MFLKNKLYWKEVYCSALVNIKKYYLRYVWDGERKAFRNSPHQKHFVSNKNSTCGEALLLLSEFDRSENYLDNYIIPAADFVVSQQVLCKGDTFGGIYQEEAKDKTHKRIMTYYVARCVPFLLQVYQKTGYKKYLSAAKLAGKFLKSMEEHKFEKGAFAQEFINAGNKWCFKKYPLWIAASGDIVRALYLLNKAGEDYDLTRNVEWIVKGMDANGGIRTALGLNDRCAERVLQPSVLDVLHVVGWNDKSFRLFSELASKNLKLEHLSLNKPLNVSCSDGVYYEDNKCIVLTFKTKKFVYNKKTGSQVSKAMNYCRLLGDFNVAHKMQKYEYGMWRLVKTLITQRYGTKYNY